MEDLDQGIIGNIAESLKRVEESLRLIKKRKRHISG